VKVLDGLPFSTAMNPNRVWHPIRRSTVHVRFCSNSGLKSDIAPCPQSANRRHQSGVDAGLWEPHFLQHPGW